MKIAVIGANGKTGRVFVNEAVQRGHTVHAGVYRHNYFTDSDYIKVIKCDAMVLSEVEKLIKGCDAVVSLIGHSRGSPEFLQTTATANILSAMSRYGMKRFVSLTGTAVRAKGDKITLSDRVLTILVMLVDSARVRDGRAHAELIKKSKLDWTILRVQKLANLPQHRLHLSKHGPARPIVSRVSASAGIIDILVEDIYKKSMPIVSRKK